MLGNVVKIRWDLVSEAVPAFITIALMPLTYSIAYGGGCSFRSYFLTISKLNHMLLIH